MYHKIAKTLLTIAATLLCAVAVATPKIYCPQVLTQCMAIRSKPALVSGMSNY